MRRNRCSRKDEKGFYKNLPTCFMKIETNKAILSIFYGRRIPTEVFVPCLRKQKKTFRSLSCQRFFIPLLCAQKHAVYKMSGFFSRRGQFHLIRGLVAHRIY